MVARQKYSVSPYVSISKVDDRGQPDAPLVQPANRTNAMDACPDWSTTSPISFLALLNNDLLVGENFTAMRGPIQRAEHHRGKTQSSNLSVSHKFEITDFRPRARLSTVKALLPHRSPCGPKRSAAHLERTSFPPLRRNGCSRLSTCSSLDFKIRAWTS